jgi:hypothetical protein
LDLKEFYKSPGFRLLKTALAFVLFVPCFNSLTASGGQTQSSLIVAELGNQRILSVDAGIFAAGAVLLYVFMCIADKYFIILPGPLERLQVKGKTNFKTTFTKKPINPLASKNNSVKVSFSKPEFSLKIKKRP